MGLNTQSHPFDKSARTTVPGLLRGMVIFR